ncbi:hypothetical protein EIN_209190 [Entamoeba invadens IP1]|uniref:Leucine rich repeat containing protein BspA family protein n=1 Tax=Entamoeba invadens IP1 TaxID=370355 RepID=L7FPA9_ENTIV|nr:hypothetical protein EIN_209190 [Entamoeba invadens IP1]ELP94510.1 hypothetical protein EIN_209190 [Entamoeba invadens IP1]|eukprot:XP_004261281.1 hypothetical protein EIN_209190 [Entamoeba invadens IP1]
MNSKLDRYSLMIVSKYFKTMNDFINMVHVCKKYGEIPSMFHYNPIPLKNKKKFFPNIETLYLYNKSDKKIPGYFKYFYDYKVSYQQFLSFQTEDTVFNKVIFDGRDWERYHSFKGATQFSCRCFNSRTAYLPRSLDTTGVTKFEELCFIGNAKLEEIILDSRLTHLPLMCFQMCTNLKAIDLRNVKHVANNCFERCLSLTALTFGEELLSVGRSSFYKCTNIINVTTFGLTKLDTLINLSSSKAFAGIKHDILVSAEDVQKYGKDKAREILTLPIDEIDYDAFSNTTDIEDSQIPRSVTKIGNRAFSNCGIKNLDLTNVTQIGCYGNLDSVTAVTLNRKMQFKHFQYLHNLSKIEFGNSYRNKTFNLKAACYMKSILDANNIIYEQGFVFTKADVTHFGGKVPSYCSRIGGQAFHKADITSIEIPKGVTKISDPIKQCDSLEIIETETFLKCFDLFVENCQKLRELAWRGKGKVCIQNCPNLTAVTFTEIPKQFVSSIDFSYCKKLKEMVIEKMPQNGVFKERVSSYVFDLLKDKSKFVNVVFDNVDENDVPVYMVPDGINIIPKGTFQNRKNLQRVVMPTSLKKIERGAFCGCENLMEVVGMNKEVHIENHAFEKCPFLKSKLLK